MKIGIMQGRLTESKDGILQKLPDNWVEEFQILKKFDLDYIELFTKGINDKCPIWNHQDLLTKKIETTNLKSLVICDNFSLKESITNNNYVKYLKQLISRLIIFNKPLLIIPITGENFSKKSLKLVVLTINKIVELCNKNNVLVSFEIELSIKDIINLSQNFIKNEFKITFDTGNICLSEKTDDLSQALISTKDLINHIHIKDRNKFGDNVPIGNGIINFKKFFKTLSTIKYKKNLTLETSRGKNALETAKKNIKKINKFLIN